MGLLGPDFWSDLALYLRDPIWHGKGGQPGSDNTSSNTGGRESDLNSRQLKSQEVDDGLGTANSRLDRLAVRRILVVDVRGHDQ